MSSSPEIPSVWTIPDLVSTILRIVEQVTQMLVDSKSGTVDEQIARNQNYSENALVEEATALTSYYNHYVLVLGTEFSCGDDDAVQELRMVYATLPQDDMEVEELRILQRGFTDLQKLEFTMQLKSQLAATKAVLQELANRKGFYGIRQYSFDLKEQVRKLFPTYISSATFCEGALHLQKYPKAVVSAVASGQPGGGGYACNHCDLDLRCMEIDQAGTISFREAEWRMLAACHMRAHFSFKNLGAWYMCRVCHDLGVDPPEVFVSPVAMMEHLENHENGE